MKPLSQPKLHHYLVHIWVTSLVWSTYTWSQSTEFPENMIYFSIVTDFIRRHFVNDRVIRQANQLRTNANIE